MFPVPQGGDQQGQDRTRQNSRPGGLVTWLYHACDMTHSCVYRGSCMHVTRLIHIRDMSHSYTCKHDWIRQNSRQGDAVTYSFECVTRRIRMCTGVHSYTGAHSYMGHDSFICVLWHDWFIHVAWLTHTFDTIYSYVCRDSLTDMRETGWHDSFICASHVYVYWGSFIPVTWLIHVCDNLVMYLQPQSNSETRDYVTLWCDWLYVWHDPFVFVPGLIHRHTYANQIWCGKTRTYVCDDSRIRVTWLSLMCAGIHS